MCLCITTYRIHWTSANCRRLSLVFFQYYMILLYGIFFPFNKHKTHNIGKTSIFSLVFVLYNVLKKQNGNNVYHTHVHILNKYLTQKTCSVTCFLWSRDRDHKGQEINMITLITYWVQLQSLSLFTQFCHQNECQRDQPQRRIQERYSDAMHSQKNIIFNQLYSK